MFNVPVNAPRQELSVRSLGSIAALSVCCSIMFLCMYLRWIDNSAVFDVGPDQTKTKREEKLFLVLI